MDCKKISGTKIILLVITCIISIIYIGIIILYNYCTINKQIEITAIVGIPILSSLLFLLIKVDSKTKKIVTILLSIINTIAFFAIILISFVALLWIEGITEIDDPLRYNELRNSVGYFEFIEHFPKELSKDVMEKTTTQFFYRPQFLQGGFNFELLIEQSEQELGSIAKKYEKEANNIIVGNNDDFSDVRTFGYPHTFFDGYEEFDEFIQNSTIYLIDCRPYEENNWNHGVYTYVAINRMNEKVLYFTEVW